MYLFSWKFIKLAAIKVFGILPELYKEKRTEHNHSNNTKTKANLKSKSNNSFL